MERLCGGQGGGLAWSSTPEAAGLVQDWVSGPQRTPAALCLLRGPTYLLPEDKHLASQEEMTHAREAG